jgi:hypothetical protein
VVLIRHAGGNWHQPESSSFKNEKELQELVKLSPSLLRGEPSIAVVDEFTIPGIGSADLLGIGIGGDITIVECKLVANPEIRREVVGQVLAYAGGLWRMTYENFAATFSRCAGTSLTSAVAALQDGTFEESEFRDAVAQRLETGEFQLIITVDEITPELKTIVEYLNEHTLPTVQVLALELAYAREGDIELLIPTVYGEESVRRKGGRPGIRWTEDTFAEQIEARTTGPVRDFVDRLLLHGSQRGDHPFYGSGAMPGMSYFYALGGRARSVWALYLEDSSPYVAVSFGKVDTWSHDAAVVLLNKLKGNEKLAGPLVDVDEGNLNRFPSIAIDPVLIDPAAQATFFEALDQLLEEKPPDVLRSPT